MAVRKFTNRGKVTGKFYSLKMGRLVQWESSIEHDYFYLLEFDKDVIYYEEQPLRIYYTLNAKEHYYTPDVLVTRKNEKKLVEIKPEGQINLQENKVKFEVGKIYSYEKGYSFTVVTDNLIRRGHKLENIKLLYRYAKQDVLNSFQLQVYKSIKKLGGKAKIRDLISELKPTVEGQSILPSLYSLLYHGGVYFELEEPLTLEATISITI